MNDSIFPEPTVPARAPERRHSPKRRWIATGAAVLTLAAIGMGVATLPPGTPVFQSSTVAQAQADPVTAAIQQVIQQANNEQVQAIATNNPSVMSDTATAAHYQELVQVNQGLVSNGVTGISLAKLGWGPISVNGSTATATSYETWITTFSDGTTMQSLDTNVYTLVQQNGAWVIQADQQPTPTAQPAGQTAPAPAQPAPAPAQPAPQAPLPTVPTSQSTSHNWSGYAATGSGTYTGVTGTWTVPPAGASSAPGVSATWVGIGGVTTRDLIQAGTQDVASGTGQAQYQSWIELLPQASQQVPLAVVPGDSVTVSINQQASGSNWLISFKNNTTGQTYQTTVQYTSSLSSAEWIQEAPSGRSGILPLDNFGTVPFTAASATQGGQTVDLTQAGAQPISLLGAGGQALAVPSVIGSDGSSFSVTRTAVPATITPSVTTRRGGMPGLPNVQPVMPLN